MGLTRARIIAAALDLLGAQGLDGLTMRALAAALGIRGATLYHHFEGKAELLDHMAGEMLRPVWQPPRPGQGWADWLGQGAVLYRQAMRTRRDGAQLMIGRRPVAADGHVDDLLAPLMASGFSGGAARQALAVIGRFTLGWTLEEQAGIGGQDGDAAPDTAFGEGLALVLAGIATMERVAEEAPPRRQMLVTRLWALLRSARESGELAYGRTTRLNEVERQILMLLDRGAGRTSAELSSLIGKDKGQISRAVAALIDQALVVRDGPRRPLRLAPEGRRMAGAMMALGIRRDAELVQGMDAQAHARLLEVVAAVTRRAAALFEQEKALAQAEGGRVTGWFQAGQVDLGPARDDTLIVPRLVTLLAYIQRSAALAIKRLLGLTSFDGLVLSQVADCGPVSQRRLISALDRDQSQAGRALKRLVDLGFVAREDAPGGRRAMLTLTAAGGAAHEVLLAEGWRRDAVLIGDLDPETRGGFVAALDAVARNAHAQMERERAAGRQGDGWPDAAADALSGSKAHGPFS